MTTKDMDCDQFVELVTAYMEGALEPGTRARFKSHLMECDGCEHYLGQFRTTAQLLGDLREGLDPEVRARLLAAFRDWQ